jgi:glycosyltransferase involved in cell wall biosynthesis
MPLCRKVALHRTKHKTELTAFAEVAEKFGESHIGVFGLGIGFAPKDLLTRAYSHHLAVGNDYTEVTGLPEGTTPEIYSSELLFYLLNLRPSLALKPRVAIRRLLSEASTTGQQLSLSIRTQVFDAAATYSIAPGDLPENVRLFFPSDIKIARRVICAIPNFSSGDSGGVVPLQFWKQAAIAMRRQVREGIAKDIVPSRYGIQRAGPRRVLYASTASAFSGAEESCCRLIDHIDPARFTPYALVAMRGAFTERLEQAGASVICPQEDFGNPGVDSFLYVLKVLKSVQPDIIHLNGLVGAPVIFAAALLGIPVVQHVRVANLQGYGEALRNAEAVITVSDFVRREVIKCDVPRENVHVILNGINPEAFHRSLFNKKLMRKEFGIPQGAKVVLMIARFAPNKRHDVMLAAAEIVRTHIPSLQLVLVGEVLDAPEYYESIRDQIEARGLQNAVTFLEFQPDIRKIEATADAVVLCSDREPLGICVIEAMAMEIPVIVSDSGGTQEIVQDGRTGYVFSAGDANALAKRTIEVLSDPGLCRSLTRTARKYIESELSATTHARHVMKLYDEILGRSSA